MPEQPPPESAKIKVTCPHCGQAAQAPRELAGKTVKCPGCGEKFVLSHAQGEAPPVQVAPVATSRNDASPSPPSLMTCPACGKGVSRTAPQCPGCGHEIAGKRTEQITGIDAVIVSCAVIATCAIAFPLYTGLGYPGLVIALVPTILAFVYASRKKK